MDSIIHWSLRNRLLVVIGAAALTIAGVLVAARMPVDVFPDLTAPTVTVVTEAHGLASEEVEAVVTTPIESAVNGATGVRRVRSASGIGISVVWVEFEWGTDVYIARQIVNEKLQLVSGQIPPDVGPPVLAPMSSIMGEITFLSLRSDRHSGLEVRDTADWVLRKRLLAVPGVAQVIPIGGDSKQLQVVVAPEKLRAYQVTMAQVIHALEETNRNASGGFLVQGSQESIIRAIGRVRGKEDVERTVVDVRGGVPVLIRQLATVQLGAGQKRGEGSANGKPAVVIGITKQPGANTLELTERLDRELDDVQRVLPAGMTIERNLFRQADFISTAVTNVSHALRDGSIFVAVILFLFLFDLRATLVSLAALPLSLIVAVLAMKAADITINTMSLGGLTIAIGALVDDAIIDVENVFRRLRENHRRPESEQQPVLDVVFHASREIRSSIVFATVIVMLVFLPLLFLSGVEGRLLRPLGFAYLVAIASSLVVALTLTPALASYALPNGRAVAHDESWVIRRLKRLYLPALRTAIRHTKAVIAGSMVLLAIAIVGAIGLGHAFLPDFNEGALTINLVTLPGTSLETSDRLGRRVEEILLGFPEVAATARRTGRAELDEHAQDVNASEVDVRLVMKDRSKDALLAEIRKALSIVPGMVVTIGQPISHRIDHMLSGTRANIAVKVFGDNLVELRTSAEAVRRAMQNIPGVVDLSVEQQVDIPQLAVVFDREKLARHGLRAGEAAERIEAAFAGHKVSDILDAGRRYPLVVRYRDDQRADTEAIGNAPVDTATGAKVPLKMIADLRKEAGPNLITRENVQRKIVVMANVAGRDLGGVIDDIRLAVDTHVKLADGQHIVYGGQFESQQSATRTLWGWGVLAVAGIFLVLYLAFRSLRSALLIMANLPLALIGGVAAVYLGGGVLNVAALVGFITLFGIATRNGIMMISHYEHLQTVEGVSFEDAIERGATERLAPILMTALCAALALVPLVLAGDRPGNEIQAPMGVVILGGLLTSTALNMLVVPALYARFGRRR